MSETVRVRIKASCAYIFDQTVTMTREKWEQLKAVDASDMQDSCMSPLSDHIDLRDPTDWSDFDDVEMEVVGEDGKPVTPYDGWAD